MSKKPNKMGRIEGEPKVKRKLPWKKINLTLIVVLLVLTGVVGTLQFQKTVRDIKARGVAEYQDNNCKEFSKKYEDNSIAAWLECEVK